MYMCIYKIAQESRAIINHFLSLSLNFRANHQLPTYLDKTLPKAGLRERGENGAAAGLAYQLLSVRSSSSNLFYVSSDCLRLFFSLFKSRCHFCTLMRDEKFEQSLRTLFARFSDLLRAKMN